MIHDLKPYPAMKDTGVPWLGRVPGHWEVRSLGSLTSPISLRGRPYLPLLSVVREKGVIVRSVLDDSENHNFIPDDLSNYKVVHEGDLVINKMKAWQGSLGIAPSDGIVSPAYYVFDLAVGDRRYGEALLRSKPYVAFFGQASDGVRIGQWDLSVQRMKRIPVVLPSLPEQTAIVRFLDHADRRIRKYILAKQKLITLLEEQKQAIIHQAVTRGLNPDVRFKPSGVEWLGDMPEHWAVKRLRHLVEGKLTYGANAAAEHTNPDWPRYLRITDFGLDGTLRSETFRSLPPEIAKDYLVRPSDILIARSGATVGKAYIVPASAETACHAGYLIRARPRQSVIEPDFLFAFTQSAGFARWKDSTFIIATIQNIGADKYADLPVPVPPRPEQSNISRFLQEATGRVLTAKERAQNEISLLREYRTRLIADVVTGKLDVRDAAANLPDEAEEPEVLYEAEDLPQAAEEVGSYDGGREED